MKDENKKLKFLYLISYFHLSKCIKNKSMKDENKKLNKEILFGLAVPGLLLVTVLIIVFSSLKTKQI